MVAPPTLLRKAEGAQSGGRVEGGSRQVQRGQQYKHYKGRDTANFAEFFFHELRCLSLSPRCRIRSVTFGTNWTPRGRPEPRSVGDTTPSWPSSLARSQP